MTARPIAVIGAGSIGIAWAIVFARAGMTVRLQDPDAARRAAAPAELLDRLAMLHAAGLCDDAPAAVLERIGLCDSVVEAVSGALHVQENAPERLEVKRALFAELVAHAPADASLASSSSFIAASRFAPKGAAGQRCLVAHPGNPPFLLRAVEIVPSPATDLAVAQKVSALMHQCGLLPVMLRKEAEGFVFNRLQGAVLREAYALVRDGVIGAADLDTVMTEGLGPRWAVVGPFETADLNTRGGIVAHAEKMGPSYARMGAERGQHDPWTPELVAQVEAERRAAVPLDRWEDRVAWRDAALMQIIAAKRRLPRYGPEEE
jgi:3-hydroxyacyl-CoA dehydrogenase